MNNIFCFEELNGMYKEAIFIILSIALALLCKAGIIKISFALITMVISLVIAFILIIKILVIFVKSNKVILEINSNYSCLEKILSSNSESEMEEYKKDCYVFKEKNCKIDLKKDFVIITYNRIHNNNYINISKFDSSYELNKYICNMLLFHFTKNALIPYSIVLCFFSLYYSNIDLMAMCILFQYLSTKSPISDVWIYNLKKKKLAR